MVFVLHIMPLKYAEQMRKVNDVIHRCASKAKPKPKWNKIEFHLCSLHSIAIHTAMLRAKDIKIAQANTLYWSAWDFFLSLYKWIKYKIFNALVLHLENWYKERGRDRENALCTMIYLSAKVSVALLGYPGALAFQKFKHYFSLNLFLFFIQNVANTLRVHEQQC